MEGPEAVPAPAAPSAPAAGREYPAAVRVGVGVVVWRGDRVLLVRRGRPPRQGEWGLPGGGQELGETVFQAAEREVREETGLTVEPTGVLTVVDSITRDADGRIRFHYTLIEVTAEWRAGEPAPADDVDDVRWARLDEIDGLVAWDETRRIIRLAARGRPAVPERQAPRLRPRPDMGRLMRSPIGGLIARPWLDAMTLRLLRDWGFPMLRAWAAAQVAGGDPDAFCAALPLDPARVQRSAWLLSSLRAADAAAVRVRETEAAWRAALFAPAGTVPLADAVAAEEARLDAAHALLLTELRFAVFARAHRLAPCRWDVPAPEMVEAWHGARLRAPETAYALPEAMPPVEESSRLPGPLGEEYWLRFPSPWPAVDTPCWARVFEPDGVADPPTVIDLHAIGYEADHARLPLREIATLVAAGIRVVAPEAPSHGRRRLPGFYGGEPVIARAPAGILDHFAAHVRELGVLTAWARRRGAAPVGWVGTSLGAFTAQLAATHAGAWPAASRPDALLLFATSEGIEDIAIDGELARALGVDAALRRGGWTPELLRRWRPLTDPVGPPACGGANVFMVLGALDAVAPFRHGIGIARRWGVPEGQIHVRRQGHFSVPAGLMADDAPVTAFAAHLKRL